MKKYLIIISVIIIAISVCAICINKKYGFIQTNDVAERIYKQGLEDIKNNDLQNAYYNFSKISQFNTYYETALFHQGLIATELEDYDSAIKAYETLLEKFPNTFFKEKSIYNLAVAYYKNNLNEKAYANFQLITKKFSDSDYADASNYFLGELIKNTDKNKAAEHFINYLNIAPQGKYAISSIETLISLKDNFSPEQNLTIGAALLANDKNEEALKFLNMARLNEAWAYLSIAYNKTGNIKLSRQIFEDGIRKYSQNGNEIQQSAVDMYADSFRFKEQGLKEAKTLCDNAKCQLNDYIMFNLLQYVDKTTKNEYYNRIYEEFPNGNYAAEALFNSMFNEYIAGNYDNAIIKGKKHISKYSDKKSAPAALYWLGKAYDKKRNHQEANSCYNKVFTKYPDTYYAYLSVSKTNKISNPYNIKNKNKISEKSVFIDLPILHANIPINYSKKINELLKVGDFKIFENADFDNEIIKSWIAYYEGDLTKASVTAEKILSEAKIKPTFDDDIFKLAYPIGYPVIINKTVEENNISSFLILSIIRKESRFNPDAVSSTGAMGLMQLMPDTAKYIADITNTQYDKSKLFTPDYNIDLGTKYYAYIKKNYHSDDLFALASYNGGHGNVDIWKSKINTADLDEFVERIPFQETKDYVKQIYKNYWVYNCIYNSARVK